MSSVHMKAVGFVRYPHLEKLAHDDVAGLLEGDVHVFPKIDGTNGSIWLQGGVVRGGSRNRTLSLEKDNAEFLAHVIDDNRYKEFFKVHPGKRLFGEWLVPHTLKTYREDAWKKFYVFDVMDENGDFMPYEQYKDMLSFHDIDFIPCTTIIKFPTNEQLLHELNKNTFLIEDGKGVGEGIVLKRYGFKNIYGRTTWGKVVRTEFKDSMARNNPPNEVGADVIELTIAQAADIPTLAKKEWAKIKTEMGWNNKLIPMLLGKVYHEFFHEELWTQLKKNNDPMISFKRLKRIVMDMTKKALPEVF